MRRARRVDRSAATSTPENGNSGGAGIAVGTDGSGCNACFLLSRIRFGDNSGSAEASDGARKVAAARESENLAGDIVR
jgi:hypothetical protein